MTRKTAPANSYYHKLDTDLVYKHIDIYEDEIDQFELISDISEYRRRLHYKSSLREEDAPKTLSKMSIVKNLMGIGKWEIVKQWITDNGLWDLYSAATVLKTDNEYYEAYRSQLLELLEISDEQLKLLELKCVYIPD